MSYDNKLPAVKHLLALAKEMEFPALRRDVEKMALKRGLSEDVVAFIDLFPADEVFQNRVDFMTRCEEVEILIDQERSSPVEYLRSPQD